jgi:hypothetical protein
MLEHSCPYWIQTSPFLTRFVPKVTLEWTKRKHGGSRYRYYIFLNSSVRGPFLPAYMPKGWQWTRAFTDRLGGSGDVRGISSSLVCLPEVDAGGRGPRMESWAFALDQLGMRCTSPYLLYPSHGGQDPARRRL